MSLMKFVLMFAALVLAVPATAQKADPCVAAPTRDKFDQSYFQVWNSLPQRPQLALLMANDYKGMSPENYGLKELSNPGVDARALAQLLLAKDYRVVCLTNLTAEEMVDAIAFFTSAWNSAAGDQQGLIYFAGHGGQEGDQPFVVPTDMDSPRAPGKLHELLISHLIAYLPGQSSLSVPIMIIDACRSPIDPNSLEPEPLVPHGVSHIPPPLSGVQPNYSIFYSTSQGQIASDGDTEGPFVRALTTRLGQERWQPSNPWLADVIVDVRAKLAPDQIPSDIATNMGGMDEYFWSPPDPQGNPADDMYWRLGSDAHEAKHDALRTCEDIGNDLKRLATLGNLPWIAEAQQSYRNVANGHCTPAQLAANGLQQGLLALRSSIGTPSTHVAAIDRAVIREATYRLAPMSCGPTSGTRRCRGRKHCRNVARPNAAVGDKIAAAIEQHLDGVVVKLRAGLAGTPVLVGGKPVRTLLAGDVQDGLYATACLQAGACNAWQVRLISDKDGSQIFVSPADLEASNITYLALPIDLHTGQITDNREPTIFPFLQGLNDGPQVGELRVSVVQNGATIDPTFGRPRDALTTAIRAISAVDSILRPAPLHTVIEDDLAVDYQRRSECYQVQGACLLIEAIY